ncbi:MAG: outer membrane protein assembly factor BamD [Acidobacteriia bacterium]|nr:outer membrane protein assembly factor BamD [Terriglobia bacterium]
MLKRWAIGIGISLMIGSLCGCLGFGHKKAAAVAPTTETEPDKILFERGVADIEKGRYDVGRLTLQTLINTYPDSEYLSKAKLQIADSFYKQGGTAGLVQAKAEYMDFRTFFPNDPDAAEAQMKAAMTNYRQMEKPDRDRTQARAAEEEFKFMLAQYPKSQYAPEAQQKLREVQEVLAEGNYEVGRQYFLRRSYRAAMDRFKETLQKYPDYSGQDKALWLLAQSYERSNNDRGAAETFAKIVQYFPDSDYFDKSKEGLANLNVPIPATDPKAVEVAKQEEANRARKGMMSHVWGMMKKNPDVTLARTTPSPMPPFPTETASKQPPPSPEPGVGGASAEIAVGQVSTSATSSKATTDPGPSAPAPSPSTNKDTSPPAASSPPSDESKTAVDENKKSSSSEDSKSTSKKKKKSPIKKILRF